MLHKFMQPLGIWCQAPLAGDAWPAAPDSWGYAAVVHARPGHPMGVPPSLVISLSFLQQGMRQ